MDSSEQMIWITVIGAAAGAFALIVKALSRSKCDTIEVCCIKIHRDVAAESKLDEMEITAARGPSTPNSAAI